MKIALFSLNTHTLKFIFILIFINQSFFAQEKNIEGQIVDKNNLPLEYASVALLRVVDSVMISFTVSDDKGYFKIVDASEGTFLLQVYSTGFLPYSKIISYKNESINLKTIKLAINVQQLEEVTITAIVPVQIKKDTISFNANFFKIHHDDNIEDLLKKLPGIEFDSDGSIKAQGNDITKIYVDGKEFFSGDPLIVLKNLSAEYIDKIEVIDKKSDEAELTGVDDTQKSYVINFTLKKDKKRNGFGKFSGGIGLEGEYLGNLNYNIFNPKLQLSVIGKVNNINVTGSNIKDFLNFTGGLSEDQDEIEESTSIKNNKKALSGYLTHAVGGINLGYELKKKEVISLDYFYNNLENIGTSTSKRVSYTRKNNFFSESVNNNQSTSANHNLNFNYENKNSKTSRLFIKGKFFTDNRTSVLDKDDSYFNELYEIETLSEKLYSTKNCRKRGDLRVNYYKRIHKNKRNFSVGMFASSNSATNFKDQNTITTNQKTFNINEVFTEKNESFKNHLFNFNFKYTEPLGNNHYLKFQSTFIFKNSTEIINQTKTKNFIDEPSLNYTIKNDEQNYNTSFTYNYNNKNTNLLIGSELQNLYRDFGLVDAEKYKKNQVYLNPKISFRYKPKNGKNVSLNYKRVIRSPRNSQSAPVINDINPFNIRKGNPDLYTEKIDNLNIIATAYNHKTTLSYYSKINYQHIRDAIISNLVIDDDYVTTRSFQNYGNQDKVFAEFSLNKRIKKLGIRYNAKVEGVYKTYNSIINLEINDITSKEYIVGSFIENNKKNFLDLKIGFDYSVNNTTFSVEESLNREFVKQHYYSKFDFDISKKFNINTQFDYYLYSDSIFHSKQKIPFWNIGMSYTFTKNNNGILKLLLIDILDRNVDIERISTINYFEETTNEMLGRYLILSLTLRLNRNG